MREGRYAVIFKRKDGGVHGARKPAGGLWYFSGCFTTSQPILRTLEGAQATAKTEAKRSPSLIYDVKRMS